MNGIDAALVALAAYDDLKNRGRYLSERADEDAFYRRHAPTVFDDRVVRLVSVIGMAWSGFRRFWMRPYGAQTNPRRSNEYAA